MFKISVILIRFCSLTNSTEFLCQNLCAKFFLNRSKLSVTTRSHTLTQTPKHPLTQTNRIFFYTLVRRYCLPCSLIQLYFFFVLITFSCCHYVCVFVFLEIAPFSTNFEKLYAISPTSLQLSSCMPGLQLSCLL